MTIENPLRKRVCVILKVNDKESIDSSCREPIILMDPKMEKDNKSKKDNKNNKKKSHRIEQEHLLLISA